MTNVEAIKYLKWIRPVNPYSLDKKKVQESIDFAIKALEERPQGEFTLNELKGYLLFYGYSSDAVEDTLINFESYVKGKRGAEE